MGRPVRIQRARRRRGIGLIEVIACTALVAVLITPIALVIRASGQSIAQSAGSRSVEADLRRGLRWITDVIRESDVIDIRNRELELDLPNGNGGLVSEINNSLVLDDGNDEIAVMSDIKDVRFTEIRTKGQVKTRIGIEIRLRATDPVTGAVVSVTSVLSIPPQA